ncbi:LysE family transporter [Ralstonia mannitolilytica]|uniref:Homoserine/homoserine lactone efflux protein n=1 Tax=Ralstonia mannitolilytica TaxID=105219 RepID=A0AAD2ATH6_9RALS|nr:LysE family transporter [Ralstonia mannitolilytica]ATG20944.1 lysine transporter LysE [Ralstonia pickettii]ANA33793.1 lysine transporter LysE [Ralstonia mannitolilytica]MBY4720152.1 LysE family transporter [Ralstonia mannitolilytica]CAJ0690492.1 Homoserine/homoserine lactone efflux protein [Ralstonia mannitolilytica]CAJ0692267.1 Homoserine/homoserine lactone efflux protein [Ralstonia mannitolilytica]
MTLQVWLAFFLASWVIAISPGSGAILSMTHGLTHGVRRTSVTIAGLEVGLVVILFIAGAGLGALLVASEHAFTAIKIIGALYLIYLGIVQWRTPIQIGKPADGEAVRGAGSGMRRFLVGLLTNLTNPKGILFMVAVLPQFIDPARPLLAQLGILAVTMVFVDLIVMHGYALLASRAQRLFRNPRALRWQSRFFGGMLMSIGAALFFVKRQTA